MSKLVKRSRILADKNATSEITIRPLVDRQGYSAYLVQGWKQNGKWQRKQFKKRQDAERFAALKRVEAENHGRAQRMILSVLTQDQHDRAVEALNRLGETYTLVEAVDFFLRHHRPPDFTIRASDALKLYLDDKERDGVRVRTVKAIRSVINQFVATADDPWVHEIKAPMIETYLRGLRAKHGNENASRKTWNNYRNDLGGFLGWCAKVDAGTNRPFTFENPVPAIRKFSARQVREEQDAKPSTTAIKDVLRLFSALMRWRGGVMLRYFAYLYFAGIRPEEAKRLSGREGELLNLKTRTLTIPASISKTRHERQVRISDNFAAWLEFAPGPIVPTNFDTLAKSVRKHFRLSHDEARHSYISYHVAVHRSIGDAALQAGNSEDIVRRHYLNTHSQDEGQEFFYIFPDASRRRARSSRPENTAIENLGTV